MLDLSSYAVYAAFITPMGFYMLLRLPPCAVIRCWFYLGFADFTPHTG